MMKNHFSTIHSIMVFISESFTSDPSRKMHVLTHNSDSSSMKSTKIDIFEQSNNIGFSSFLESSKGGGLESEFAVVSLCQWSNKSLEGKSLHQTLGRPLIPLDISHSNCTRSPSTLLSLFLNWFLSSFPLLGLLCHVFCTCHFCFQMLNAHRFIHVFMSCVLQVFFCC